MNIKHTFNGKKHIVIIGYSDEPNIDPDRYRHKIETEDIEIVKLCLRMLYDKTNW